MIGNWAKAIGLLVMMYFILYSTIYLMFEVLAWLRSWSSSYPQLLEFFTL